MKDLQGALSIDTLTACDRNSIADDVGMLNSSEGLVNKQDLFDAYHLPLPRLVESAIAIRTQRAQAGAPSHVCASGYLPHYDERGCEMSCSFCGYPEKIYEKGTRQFISQLTEEAIIEDALKKKKSGATRYKIVSLGCSIRDEEYEVSKRALRRLFDEMGFKKICLSFGVLSENRIKDLVDNFGIDKIEINHNLEVGSPETYEKLIGNNQLIWQQRYNTIANARRYGLKVCAGGLTGIGETTEDQVDLVLALRSLNVTSTPFNVFVLDENDKSVIASRIRNREIRRPSDEELLRTLCVWRLGLPNSSIAVNSGFGSSGDGDFGIYSGLVELQLINDKVSLPNQGVISMRRYYRKNEVY